MASTAVVPTGPIQDASKPKHTSSTKVEDHAALAALYVTKYDKSTKDGNAYLDGDHRLSSAGAAASLKYASPQDLPSYPSSGLKKNNSAAGAAASLGWANQKPFEQWKPDASSSASAAAMMAKDYKMKELRQPEQSAHGAKAALLAHKDSGKVEIWRPEADSPWGNSAATRAFKKHGSGGLSPVLDYGYTDIGRKGSVMAATGAMSESRRRALSSPDPNPKPQSYPDEANAVSNALSAATSAHRRQKRSDASDAGSTPYTTMSREMYTSHPPVAPEVNEKNHNDTLRASAVAMARQIYNVQQKQVDQMSHAQSGAAAAHKRKSSTSTVGDEVAPMRFNNLQEAAQKLAQERLAKLHDEHVQNIEYRDYYKDNHSQPASRFSIRGRARRRASSDGELDDDKAQSNKIRAQMSIFSNNLSQVDEKKRASDREALIAAAQRNVTKSLHGMDERVFADTGKIAPSLLNEWEVKAHTAAQAKSDTRMENHGKIHIGGGKFMDQSEVDAVARGNVQPVLDEINEKAAAENERQAAAKAEQEHIALKAAEKKQRDKEKKAIDKKLRQQDKDEEKLRIQDEKEERKAAQRAEKEKRKSGGAGVIAMPKTTSAAAEPTATSAVLGTEVLAADTTEDEPRAEGPVAAESTASESKVKESKIEEPTPTTALPPAPPPIRTSMEDQASLRMQQIADAANQNQSTPLSPSTGSPKSKISWLKTKFSRRLSRGQKSGATASSSGDNKEAAKDEKGFVGGAALTGAGASAKDSTASLGASSRDAVAMAGKGKETEPAAGHTTSTVPAAATLPEAETSATLDPAHELTEPAILPAPIASEAGVHVATDDDPEDLYSADAKPRIGRPAPQPEDIDLVSPISAVSPISNTNINSQDTAPSLSQEKEREKKTAGDDDDEFQEARDNFDEDLVPPPTFPAENRGLPAREARFTEVMD